MRSARDQWLIAQFMLCSDGRRQKPMVVQLNASYAPWFLWFPSLANFPRVNIKNQSTQWRAPVDRPWSRTSLGTPPPREGCTASEEAAEDIRIFGIILRGVQNKQPIRRLGHPHSTMLKHSSCLRSDCEETLKASWCRLFCGTELWTYKVNEWSLVIIREGRFKKMTPMTGGWPKWGLKSLAR